MRSLADFKNKKVLIMGLGLHGGGVGAAEFFARLGSHIVITDLKSREELTTSLVALRPWRKIRYHLGGHRTSDFTHADVVIKNPGVPETSKFLKIAQRAKVPILSDVEIFFLTCPAPIIGITGTKGKSTTTWLIGEFLKATKKRVWVGGNIRTSLLTFLPKVKRGDWVIVELSSFQLDSLKHQRMSPGMAVITNIFPDHLNRYPSMRSYIASKSNIFIYQKKSDYLFINARDRLLERITRSAHSTVIRLNPERIMQSFKQSLSYHPPVYHLPNIALAIGVATRVGVGEAKIRQVLRRFRGLPGRMEAVRKFRGITFINDTTATNPHAAARAVRATKKLIAPYNLHVIAGGSDKGLPVRDFVTALTHHAASAVFLPGTATVKMTRAMRKQKSKRRLSQYHAQTMPQAVHRAFHTAKNGDTVLLSPGAASFGLFQHEFDRGDKFIRAVKRLPH